MLMWWVQVHLTSLLHLEAEMTKVGGKQQVVDMVKIKRYHYDNGGLRKVSLQICQMCFADFLLLEMLMVMGQLTLLRLPLNQAFGLLEKTMMDGIKS